MDEDEDEGVAETVGCEKDEELKRGGTFVGAVKETFLSTLTNFPFSTTK